MNAKAVMRGEGIQGLVIGNCSLASYLVGNGCLLVFSELTEGELSSKAQLPERERESSE